MQLTASSCFYKAEPYLKIKVEEVQEYLRDYCRLQSQLLRLEIGITNFRLGLDKLNFMKDKTGSFKWVDYGGIGFSFDRRRTLVHNNLLPSIPAQFQSMKNKPAFNHEKIIYLDLWEGAGLVVFLKIADFPAAQGDLWNEGGRPNYRWMVHTF